MYDETHDQPNEAHLTAQRQARSALALVIFGGEFMLTFASDLNG